VGSAANRPIDANIIRYSFTCTNHCTPPRYTVPKAAKAEVRRQSTSLKAFPSPIVCEARSAETGFAVASIRLVAKGCIFAKLKTLLWLLLLADVDRRVTPGLKLRTNWCWAPLVARSDIILRVAALLRVQLLRYTYVLGGIK
jgi:hypothetical protein